MVSSPIYLDSLNMVGSRMKPTIFSQETTQIAENNQSRQLSFFSHTKLSLRKTSSCFEATTSVDRSIGYMGFMTNAKTGIVLDCGKNSRMFSIACQSPLLLTTKSYACTEDFPLNSSQYHSSSKLRDQLRSLKMGYSVIYSGLTLRRVKQVGEKMTVESHTHSARPSLRASSRKMTSI